MCPPASSPPDLIEEALAFAQADPSRAIEAASAALVVETLSAVDRSKAQWALGLARRELDDLNGAASALQEATDTAAHGGETDLAAQITSSLALVLARMGDSATALRLTDQAAEHLRGGAAARNEMQRALVLQRLGRHRESLSSYADALHGLEESGDRLAAARLRLNRSVLRVYSGALDEAVDDLEHAYRIALDEGQALLRATTAHNLGFTHGRRGDVPNALAWFETAERLYSELGGRQRAATLRSDRAEVLAEAGLLRDAVADAEAAVEDLRGEDEPPVLADALLTWARIADLAGEGTRAGSVAVEAKRLFREQGRDNWEFQARYLETLSGLRSTGDEELIDRTLELVTRLDEEGWESEGRRARVEAARVAFDHGNLAATVRILQPLEDHSPPSPPDQVAHAEALYMLAGARGEDGQARRAVRRGLSTLDRYRSGFGSPEVRAGLARHGVRLVRAAVNEALSAGDPWKVFQAVDTWRARSVDFPPVLPPDDTALAGALSDLRRVETDLREARASGEDPTDLLDRRRQIEEKVQKITRQAEVRTREASRIRRADLADALAGRALVSYFLHHDSLHAVWFDRDRWHVKELGDRTRVAQPLDALLFALHRLAVGRGSSASLEAAVSSLHDAAGTLSRLLVESLGLPDIPLVVIPTGILHRLPWHSLPALFGRPVSVVPSARAWIRAFRQTPKTGRAALVAGPDVPGGRAEVERLARLHPKANRLTGLNATTERVLDLLDGATLTHLAAHGTFRADNPLFSSLRMADGPLTVYDLERLETVPQVVVMPSCESAVSEVGVGDEVLGLAAALLRIGTAGLVAPTVTIPDDASGPLMVSLHRRIKDGAPPPVALAEAASATGGDSPAEIAARVGFISLGA